MMGDGCTPISGEQMLSCSEVELLLDDYIDGELDEKIRSRVDKHLAGCDSCAALVLDCRRLIEVARTLANEPVPASVSRRLRERLAQETGCAFGGAGLRVVQKNLE